MQRHILAGRHASGIARLMGIGQCEQVEIFLDPERNSLRITAASDQTQAIYREALLIIPNIGPFQHKMYSYIRTTVAKFNFSGLFSSEMGDRYVLSEITDLADMETGYVHQQAMIDSKVVNEKTIKISLTKEHDGIPLIQSVEAIRELIHEILPATVDLKQDKKQSVHTLNHNQLKECALILKASPFIAGTLALCSDSSGYILILNGIDSECRVSNTPYDIECAFKISQLIKENGRVMEEFTRCLTPRDKAGHHGFLIDHWYAKGKERIRLPVCNSVHDEQRVATGMAITRSRINNIVRSFS